MNKPKITVVINNTNLSDKDVQAFIDGNPDETDAVWTNIFDGGFYRYTIKFLLSDTKTKVFKVIKEDLV